MRRGIALWVGIALVTAGVSACGGDATTPAPGDTGGGNDTGAPPTAAADTADDTAEAGATCDDPPCIPCTGTAECAGRVGTAGSCETEQCTDGWCRLGAAPDDTACDDGDPCTGEDRCSAGTCVPTRPGCDDGDPCNGLELCTTGQGCAPGTPPTCDDGDPCNGQETCAAGTGCTTGEPLVCDDGDACTTGSCTVGKGCVTAPSGAAGCCTVDAECDNGSACTQDHCNVGTGACESSPVDGACDDGDPCTTADTCSAGTCNGTPVESCAVLCVLSGQPGDTVVCPLHLAAIGAPAVSLDMTVGWPGSVADLTAALHPVCTDAGCTEQALVDGTQPLLPSGHLVQVPAGPWDAEMPLSLAHVTSPDTPIGVGIAGPAGLEGATLLFRLQFVLSDTVTGVPVVLHGLSAAAGGDAPLGAKLVGRAIITTDAPCGGDVCWDGKPCTTDTCTAGACSYGVQEGACDDGNPCTTGDACAPDGMCVPKATASAGTPCTGQDLCTEIGACDAAGKCVFDPSKAVTCDPSGDAGCVAATCNPATGTCASSTLLGAQCDDGSACTQNDACSASGLCIGTPTICTGPFKCVVYACDEGTGQCAGTPGAGTCDDHDPCTKDACDPAAGCTHVSTSLACDDGNPCTTEDHCGPNGCAGTPNPACTCATTADCAIQEDGDACNGTLVCVEGTCVVDATTVVQCPYDGVECTVDWTCDKATGTCSGVPQDCDDGDVCTDDACSPTLGCQHSQVPLCVSQWICEISGDVGATVDCPIRVARRDGPTPGAGDFRLVWPASLALVNFQTIGCFGQVCLSYDLVACDAAEQKCTVQPLGTGHTVLLVPKAKADWTSWAALSIFHAGAPGTPLSQATVGADGKVSGDPLVLTARFEVLSALPAPAQVGIGELSFHPESGLPLAVTVEPTSVGRSLVTSAP